MKLFGLEVSLWTLVYILGVIIILVGYYLIPISEGFQSGGNTMVDKMMLCPALDLSIKKNKEVLEGYVASSAVTSAEGARNMLEHLGIAYKEHGCDAVIREKERAKAAEKKDP
jgi:hypothetical protein